MSIRTKTTVYCNRCEQLIEGETYEIYRSCPPHTCDTQDSLDFCWDCMNNIFKVLKFVGIEWFSNEHDIYKNSQTFYILGVTNE